MKNPFELIETKLDGIENLILDLKHQPTQKDEQDRLLTRDETCEFLKIDSSTLWAWTNKGKVKAYAIGARRYYKHSELLECLIPVKK